MLKSRLFWPTHVISVSMQHSHESAQPVLFLMIQLMLEVQYSRNNKYNVRAVSIEDEADTWFRLYKNKYELHVYV